MKLEELCYVHVQMESGREYFLPAAHHERLQHAIDARVAWYRADDVVGRAVAIRPPKVESLAFVTPTTRAQERAFLAVVYPDEWERIDGGEGDAPGEWRP